MTPKVKKVKQLTRKQRINRLVRLVAMFGKIEPYFHMNKLVPELIMARAEAAALNKFLFGQ